MRGFFFFLFSALFVALQRSNCATLVVDGVSQMSNPIANVGDTIIFKHRYHYNLYIFRIRGAFNACNFTQATPLSNPNSTTYTWHASRPGYFYLGFYNGSNEACKEGQKLTIEILPAGAQPPQPSTVPPESSPPSTTGRVYPWPFQPREEAGSPSPMVLPEMPENRGTTPFISSNPAVPLPTGEVDSNTVRDWPFSVNQAHPGINMAGLIKRLMYLCIVIIVMA